MNKKKEKVVVGISGGVDSSVSAYLLKEQGYEVIGLFMKNWDEDDDTEYCTSVEDYRSAKSVCDHIGIELHFANFAAEYWDEVFERFLSHLEQGWTPNPDIWCNRFVKFEVFYRYALSFGADFIATGHYALTHLGNEYKVGEKFKLFCAVDENKDQTYFLYASPVQALEKTIFPLGNLKKSQVRELAQKLKLPNAQRKDSTGICFIGKRSFRDFIVRYMKPNPGAIMDLDGNNLGEHQGLHFHTIGQRNALYIGGRKGGGNIHNPWFVVDKYLNTNELIVVQGENHPALFHKNIECCDLRILDDNFELKKGSKILVRIRHRGTLSSAMIENYENHKIKICFSKPQRAVSLGQSAVFYIKDDGEKMRCLGGGIICTRDNA